ncbi:MAG: transglutaminase domain-containing protein [Clostridia bacterium]|nr:transglutaminase domain-containing protein [Clostridia bacterium]
MDKSRLNGYIGADIPDRIEDEDRRLGFIINWRHMAANYGSGVDAQLLSEQILLCDATEAVLYEKPDPVRYVKGSRPILEAKAKEITEGARNEQDCAIMIMRYMRDHYNPRKGMQLFWGGTEEVLLEKGEQLCECVARLEVALLEVLGIPARIITHTIGGHVTTEVYADGKWGYVDPRCGMYFLLEDGRLASLIELCRDHSIMDRQPEEVKADVSPRFPYEGRIEALKKRYVSAVEVNTYKYYSLADSDRYDYSWCTAEDCVRLGMNEQVHAYAEIRKKVMGVGGGRGKPVIRFTLNDGMTVSEDILFAVRVNGVMAQPRIMEFYIDGSLAYSSDEWVPISELSNCQRGVTYFGGAQGSLPVSTLSDGQHTLKVDVHITPEWVESKEITFFVKKKEN